MATRNCQLLMKRGKRAVSTYMKAECTRGEGNRQLGELLDYLLDPRKSLDDFERLDWVRWLLSGGCTYEEFGRTVRHYNNATTCGLVWTANFVAYRCRTCGLSPCMSLCAECFQAGNHRDHDFNMFRSQAGGACDCGDVSVMKENGFCPQHGPSRNANPSAPPPGLLAVSEAVMPRLILRLLQYLRDNSKPDMLDTYRVTMNDAESFLTFLHSLSDMGAAMRQVITKTLTNPQLYLTHTKVGDGELDSYKAQSQAIYKAAVDSLKYPPIPSNFADLKGLNIFLEHKTFLDELLFWTVKYEFPQKMVTLLLSLLPDEHYKESFTQAFVQHYSRISRALVNSGDRSTISSSVVHVSVQLLSPEILATRMVKNDHLLTIMLYSLDFMLKGILTESNMQDVEQNFHLVVDCSRDVMREHCYWPIVSDLINVLSHRAIAHHFMSDQKLLSYWLEIMGFFQGMNLSQRELHQHVDYEPDTYYAAFSAELEICASPLWSMMVHCKSQESNREIESILKVTLTALKDWFDAINIKPKARPHPLQVSFHIPLHRYFALFLRQAINSHGVSLQAVLPSSDMLKMLMMHPLQIQVSFYEIFSGMWVRNGLQIKGQAMTYIQCHFCNSMVDADLYLLQVCASQLDADYFVKTVLDRFHVIEAISMTSSPRSGYLAEEYHTPMLEGALTLLCMLLGIRTHLGLSEEDLTQLEMVTLLCVGDRTHSQLMDLIPEKCGFSGQAKDFEKTLEQVADYKAPNTESGGTMQQGMYVPKGYVWEKHFDPLTVLLRAVHRKDFQSAMDRYTQYAQQAGLYSGKSALWPPLRLPSPMLPAYEGLRGLLHCRTMHASLFSLLYKAVHQDVLSDTVLYLVIYLLDMAVSTSCGASQGSTIKAPQSVPEHSLDQWFPSDNILQNLRHVVVEAIVAVDAHEVEEEEEDTEDKGVVTMDTATMTDIFAPAASALAGSSSFLTTISGHPLSEPSTSADMVTMATANNPSYRSTGVSAKLDSYTRTINVNESMLSLLVQLHSKLSGRKNSYAPPSSQQGPSNTSDSRIGDGPHFIKQVLDRACGLSAECAAMLSNICACSLPSGSPEGADSTLDREERRKRARERQQKLMAEFASKQKAFMEQNMSGVEMDEKPSGDEAASLVVDVAEFDCVICGQTTPSTLQRPLGLVTLLQASSVLGHRTQEGKALPLPKGEAFMFSRPPTCANVQRKLRQALLKNFDERSCFMSINIGWEGGVHVQTCGHHVHLDCHKSYLRSLRNSPLHGHRPDDYACPLCRQQASSVLPIMPSTPAAAMETGKSSTNQECASDVARLLNSSTTPVTSDLTTAMGSVMEDLTNATYSRYKNYSQTPSAENVLLFVVSVARTNLELELLQRGGHLCQAHSGAIKRPCFLPLFQVLSMHSKVLQTQTQTELWCRVTGLRRDRHISPECVSVTEKKVPLLLRDPITVLLHFLLSMPSDMSRGHFSCIVNAVFNICYAQALIVTSCKFPEEERLAWRSQSRQGASCTMDGLMRVVIKQLSASKIYEPMQHEASLTNHIICQSVWSPQTVETSVHDLTLPFLRIAALLYHHLYDVPLPYFQQADQEFRELHSFLQLGEWGQPSTSAHTQHSPSPDKTGSDRPTTSHNRFFNRPGTSTSRMRGSRDKSSLSGHDPSEPRSDAAAMTAENTTWSCEHPTDLVKTWCSQLCAFTQSQAQFKAAKTLLLSPKSWSSPRLHALPEQYDQIFQLYRKLNCITCNSLPREPTVCLACARLVCFKEQCCNEHNTLECIQHSVACGAGTGVFLIVNSSVIIVVRGSRAAIWGSVYLDQHGEEDRDLKRGRPLYLSTERYRLLEQQWISHAFDHSCKRWVPHQDQL